MTYDVEKKTDRFGEKQPAHAVYGDLIDVTSLYTNDDDLSRILSSPLIKCKEIKICVNSET